MSEIDLIPASYRILLRLRGWALRLGVAISVLVVLSVAAYLALSHTNKRVDAEIDQLQTRQEITARQREDLKQLDAQQSRFANQLDLLRELRSGTATRDMFTAIDRTLTDSGVWFLDWQFVRANSVVKSKQEAVETGYFIIVKSDDDERDNETWKIETHMTIKGQAQDHSALSKFVRRLFDQPEIQDVRIQNTKHSPRKKLVDFDLAIIVRNQGTRG